MNDLTGFQRDLLYVITSFDNPSGQRVGSEIEENYESEINYGRLYPNLDTLVDKGLVEKGQIDRRTNSYVLTEAGAQALRDCRDKISTLTSDLASPNASIGYNGVMAVSTSTISKS